MSQFPTKAAAWRAAKPLRDAVENQVTHLGTAPTVGTLVEQYRGEKMPTRHDTRGGYESWIRVYILPKWGECSNHGSAGPACRDVAGVSTACSEK